ncbi:MAG: DNA polymerase III subunit delta [Deltaproteobacteria bacterium]|nr:DNA polymerase III subunit delta [Deltaproteobacteria bacterium]
MITLLVSESGFLLERAYQRLKEDFFKGEKQSGVDIFEGKEVRAVEILEAGTTGSLFSSKRMIVIRRTEEIRKAEAEALLKDMFTLSDKSHGPKLDSETAVVFLAGKIDKRQNFWKELIEKSQFHELKPPLRRDLPFWVAEESRRLGVPLSPECPQLLVDLVGEDLGVLSLSLERLALAMPEKKRFEATDLETVVADVSSRTIFDLIESIGQRNLSHSLKLLKKGLSQRDNFPLAVAMIYRHFKILLNLYEMKGKESGEIGRLLGIPPYFVRNYQEQSRKFDRKKCVSILDQLFQADRLFKTSSLPAEILMTGFVRRAIT